ncbi:MAG: TIR domain-containing protein [Myxococcota bacterium]
MAEWEHDFFLVHASPDAFFAKELHNVLVERGKRVFLDQEVLRPGEPWVAHIEEALNKTEIVVIIESRYSAHGHYNQEETLIAIGLARGQNRKSAVIPVLLDGVPPPYGLKGLHALPARRSASEPVADNLVWIHEVALAEREGREVPERPEPPPKPLPIPIRNRNIALAITGMGLFLALGALVWPLLAPYPLKEDVDGNLEVIVGSKHILESNLLCALLAIVITEDADGYTARCTYDTGGGETARDALMKGDIHMYPDYSGTILHEYTGDGPREWLDQLKRAESARTLDLKTLNQRAEEYTAFRQRDTRWHQTFQPKVWLESLALFGFDNEWELLLSRAFVSLHPDLAAEKEARGFISLGTLFGSPAWAQLDVCSYPEFKDRQDGLRGLKERAPSGDVRTVDFASPTRRYCRLLPLDYDRAEPENTPAPWCDLVDGYGTDPETELLVHSGWAVAVRDIPIRGRHHWLTYHPVALSRSDFVSSHPKVKEALQLLHRCISKEEMIRALVELQYGDEGATEEDVFSACVDPSLIHVAVEKLRENDELKTRVEKSARRMLKQVRNKDRQGNCDPAHVPI